MSEEKRGRGRPKAETTMTPMWKEIILEAGRNGHHISHFLIELGISYDTHYEMIKRNKDYSETIKEYNKLCEQWWFAKARESVEKGESNRFNQRLWTIIMKNKFRDNWHDDKQIDITTQGDKINQDNKIQIEIIKSKLDGELDN
jgi:hypothetical protein